MAFAVAVLAGRFLFTSSLLNGSRGSSVVTQNSPVAAPNGSVGSTFKPRSRETAPFAPGSSLASQINRDIKQAGAVFKNDNVRMKTEFGASYQDGITHALPQQIFPHKISWKPTGQEIWMDNKVVDMPAKATATEARLEDHGGLKHLVYPSTYPSTDEHLYVRPEGGIEHDIILKSVPSMTEACGLGFSGMLTIDKALTIWDGDKQVTGNYTTKHGLFFKNRVGNAVFYLRDPVAYDASVTLRGGGLDKEKQALPQNQRAATACEYQLTFEKEGVKLSVVTPGKWLLDPQRAYPVVVDPTFGPFGFQDGNPPIYVGTVGTDSLIPAYAGGTRIQLEDTCPGSPLNDDAYGHIVMPFDFTYYGNLYPVGSFLFVHIDGWAAWDFPYPLYNPLRPLASPCYDYPQAQNSFAQIPNGAYPTFGAFYAMWNDLRYSGDAATGMYYFVDGVAPSRRLIIEWHKMGYYRDSNPDDVISFNLILYECQSVIEVIIGDVNQGDQYRGNSTVGIESPGDARAVYYDLYQPPAQGAAATTMVDGLALTFAASALGSVTSSVSNATGCIPLTSSFKSDVNTPVAACVVAAGGSSVPPSYSFHWTFGDGAEAFTRNVDHTYNLPGLFAPNLVVTNEFGNTATFTNNLQVTVCDIPPVIIGATPNGGPTPLEVTVTAHSTSPYIPLGSGYVRTIQSYDVANTAIVVDQLDPNGLPGQYTHYTTIIGNAALTTVNTQGLGLTDVVTITGTFLIDTPGLYRVEGVFPATSYTLPTVGTGIIYINAIDPTASTSSTLVVTSSSFHIDWKGKTPNALGILPNPDNDTISVSGYLNLQGLDLSSLAGQEVTLALNGYDPIFQGTLDTNGKAVQGDFQIGKTGSFQVSLPSGKFTCNVKGDYAVSLGIASQNLKALLNSSYSVKIGDSFTSTPSTVAYGYQSVGGKQASGTYNFGKFFSTGSFYTGGIPGGPGGAGAPGGQELLISGGFLVTNATFTLLGDTVSANISGLLSRSGGDDLRPAATSDVMVKIGNFTELLNFSNTPTFKTTGKPPYQKFTFKSKNKFDTHIQTLSWLNRAGVFQVTSVNMPNTSVGINPALARQPIQVIFTVTPENGVPFIGSTSFDIFKVSDTLFKH